MESLLGKNLYDPNYGATSSSTSFRSIEDILNVNELSPPLKDLIGKIEKTTQRILSVQEDASFSGSSLDKELKFMAFGGTLLLTLVLGFSLYGSYRIFEGQGAKLVLLLRSIFPEMGDGFAAIFEELLIVCTTIVYGSIFKESIYILFSKYINFGAGLKNLQDSKNIYYPKYKLILKIMLMIMALFLAVEASVGKIKESQSILSQFDMILTLFLVLVSDGVGSYMILQSVGFILVHFGKSTCIGRGITHWFWQERYPLNENDRIVLSHLILFRESIKNMIDNSEKISLNFFEKLSIDDLSSSESSSRVSHQRLVQAYKILKKISELFPKKHKIQWKKSLAYLLSGDMQKFNEQTKIFDWKNFLFFVLTTLPAQISGSVFRIKNQPFGLFFAVISCILPVLKVIFFASKIATRQVFPSTNQSIVLNYSAFYLILSYILFAGFYFCCSFSFLPQGTISLTVFEHSFSFFLITCISSNFMGLLLSGEIIKSLLHYPAYFLGEKRLQHKEIIYYLGKELEEEVNTLIRAIKYLPAKEKEALTHMLQEVWSLPSAESSTSLTLFFSTEQL